MKENAVTTDNIANYSFAIISIILLLFAFLVIWKIYTGAISLDGLLAETPKDGKSVDNAKASLSRFQFLIFTPPIMITPVSKKVVVGVTV